MKKEKILVTGAGGQLGSELISGLWKYYGKENVIATDIKEPQGILSEGNFEILDVLKTSNLSALLKKNRFTQIYHLAAMLSAAGEKNPKMAWRLNMESLINVLDAAVEFKIEKVYWPSSIAVFGPSTPKVETPQHTIMDPITIYGISKQAGERWCEWYYKNHGLDVRSLRYPGIIGYKTKPGGGTTDYAVDIYWKALADKKYESFLKADTYLPMMYMPDAVKATIDLMECPKEKITIRSAYNISGMSFCPSEIASEIKKHISEFEITYLPDFRQAIADSWPKSLDDSIAQKDWGWQPEYDLKKMTNDIVKNLSV
ncbi:NAD-dependent epimerase/dehydratase family protein [Chryseolinea sp. H1M3-3]|uniref:NAD-dependent epimerase/dehydratase family protein n=1 Tax=Chryseolinea sp. H1M3-3 TaxID=3034144 RepID=UPI0023EA93E8|nr:NAD-dependent epimerase/dehydratase family protein [Chryseolinea sp. H1M3-3]